jgi:dTDP-D-glucose 4,6-dehydratase
MKLIITGGAGFIGSNFVRHILNKYPNYEVVNLDLLTYAGNLENLKDAQENPNYRFVKGDIADKNLANDLVKDVDIIVNFAAESHVDRSRILLERTIFLKRQKIMASRDSITSQPMKSMAISGRKTHPSMKRRPTRREAPTAPQKRRLTIW